MSNLARLLFVTVVSMFLAACSGVTWKVTAKCDNSGRCEAGGEVGGKFEKSGANQSSIDAALFAIDVNGSTVSFPTFGRVTLSLVDSDHGTVQAARTFDWVRDGSIVVLANPTEVNSWISQSAGTADTLGYDLESFSTATTAGLNTISVTSLYDGNSTAIASYSWQNGGSCGVRNNFACQQQ